MDRMWLKKFLSRAIFLLAPAILFFSWSCSSHQNKPDAIETTADRADTTVRGPENFEKGKVLPKIPCKSNPALSFALYIPDSAYDPSSKFPVIIFFDPHGSGEYVVKKYQHLAEEFDVVLMASNDSKNGLSFDQTNTIASTLISEAISRLDIDNEIILAGFSGGARVALSAATQNQNVSSVIYCGAAIPMQANVRIFSVLGFAGTSDMNYTDVISFDQSLRNSSYNHFLIEWNGKHEWPDSVTFRNAFYWVTFNHLHSNGRAVTSQVRDFLGEYNRIYKSKGDELQQEATEEKMIFFLNGISNIDEFKSNATALQKNPSYQKELDEKQKALQQESTIKKQYIDAFQSKDLNWWKTEIARIGGIKDPQQKPMYQRLLGFISLAGFSLSNNSVQQNNFPVAEKMLAIYKLADPKNSDQAFLEACLYAKQGKQDDAIQSLQRAVTLGLSDSSKILNEPALASLQQNEKFKALISKMKKP